MRKIMVWGGTHPDELGPMELADSLMPDRDPIPNVSAGIVNEQARRLGRRVVNINMNDAYPGRLGSDVYEEHRAAQVLRINQGFDLVIDLHSFRDRGADVGFVGPRGASRAALGFIAGLGIKRMMQTNFPTMEIYDSKVISLELAREHYDQPESLREAIERCANSMDADEAKAADFEWFSHAGTAHISEYDPDNIPKSTQAFDRVPDAVAPLIGARLCPAYWLSIADTPNNQGYWAEMCVPADVPDDTLWAR